MDLMQVVAVKRRYWCWEGSVVPLCVAQPNASIPIAHGQYMTRGGQCHALFGKAGITGVTQLKSWDYLKMIVRAKSKKEGEKQNGLFKLTVFSDCKSYQLSKEVHVWVQPKTKITHMDRSE